MVIVTRAWAGLTLADGPAAPEEVGLPAAAEEALAVLAAAAEALAAAVLVGAGKMRTKEFLSRLDHDRIVSAIREAESRTSAQIRIYLQRGELKGDPLGDAQRQFQQLEMHKTRERNGVLIFIAPRAQKFAVVGDEGIHQKCGAEYWQGVVDQMREHFKGERFSDAIVTGISEVGTALAKYFPKSETGTNELPDEIVES